MSYFVRRHAPNYEGVAQRRKAHTCRPPSFNPFGWRFGFGAKWQCRHYLGAIGGLSVHCDRVSEYAVSNKGAGFWRGANL